MIETERTEVFSLLELALCRRLGDSEVGRVLDRWGPFALDDQDDRVYYISKKKGISLLFEEEVLRTVFIYLGRDQNKGYRRFAEELIQGVSAFTTHSEILALFGEPSGAGNAPVIVNPSQKQKWVRYLAGDTTIQFSFTAGEDRLDLLRVFGPCVGL